jgi:hypothetical protein
MAERRSDEARFVLDDGRVLVGRVHRLRRGARYALAVTFPAGVLGDGASEVAVVDLHSGAELTADDATPLLRGTWELPARFRLEEAPGSVGMEWSPATADTSAPEAHELPDSDVTAEPAAPTRADRPRTPGVSAALPVAVATLAVAGALVGGSVAGRGAGDRVSARTTPLTAPCPVPPAKPIAVGTTVLGCNALRVVAPGEVQQVVDLLGPSSFAVSFGYCNGFTCGDADPDCLANRYIPGWPAEVVRTVTVTPPPGATLKQAIVGTGPAPSSVRPAAAPPPTVAADGAVTVDVPSPLMSHFQTHLGRICGLGEADHTAFVQQFGPAFDNSAGAAVRLLVTWSGATNATAGAAAPVALNGSVVPQ